MNLSRLSPATSGLLMQIGELAYQRGENAYAVGGFVRDLFLKRLVRDIDITVEGDGLALAQALSRRKKARVETFTRFGTAMVILPGFGKIDIATARTETYEHPGALPRVEPSGIAQDLFRRDFTINAMALSLSPTSFFKLLDPFHGWEDLKKGRIRALHPMSFVEDPTRIFRAVRFEQRFGKKIEPETQKWLREAMGQERMNTVSGERLRHELQLIFEEPRPEKAVARLSELGVLPFVHPSLGLSGTTRKKLPHVAQALEFFRKKNIALEDEKMVWFQALLGKSSASQATLLSKRLMLSRSEKKIVEQSSRVYPTLLKSLAAVSMKPSRMYRLLSPLALEVQCFLMAMASPAMGKKMALYFLKIQKLKPWLRGRDLKALGIPPGFRYSYILLEALNGQWDGRFKNKVQALRWVKKTFASERVEGTF